MSESNGCQSYGIFWDIENCSIPSMERAANIVQNIKQFIADKYESKVGHKSEPCVFCCSCDTRHLDTRHVEALNRYGVDILHINSKDKVNADSKLIEMMQKFIEHHIHKSQIFLITGDIDFAPVIRTAKRRGFEVNLLFGPKTSQDLKNICTECHSYNEIINGRDNDVLMATNVATNDIAMSSSARTRSTATNTRLLSYEAMNVANRGPQEVKACDSGVPSGETGPPNAVEPHVEYDAVKLSKLIEVTGVEKHIAIRLLGFCGGDVQLAINTLIDN